jgi:hypothetical protein
MERICMNPKDVIAKLNEDEIFKRWKVNHSESFCSHFFVQLDNKGNLKTDWELGFYDKPSDSMTVFATINDEFLIKPEDQVFKKPGDVVEKLLLDQVKVSLENATNTFLEKVPEFFSKEILGDGFVTLQTLKQKTLWNFTFVTKTLKFANMRISANDGSIESHQSFSLIDKGPLSN